MPYTVMKLLYTIVNSSVVDTVCCFYQAYLQSNLEIQQQYILFLATIVFGFIIPTVKFPLS